MKALLDNVTKHCKNDNYLGKTVMFCWEHKNIPYIVAKFGLIDDPVTWGLDPYSEVGLYICRSEQICVILE